jgi:hypothetical protein
MPFKPFAGVCLVVCATVAGLGAQQQLSFLATVTDPATGVAVDKLDPADVRMTEDGAVGKVLKIESVKQKVKVQVLLDTGLGLPAESVTQLRAAVRGLVEALPAGVEATLVTTSPQPRFLVRSTANREELLRGVERLAPDRGAGRFVESLAEAAERAVKDPEGTFNILIAAGTTSGDTVVSDGDVARLMKSVKSRPMRVHVLIFSSGLNQNLSGGVVQTEVGPVIAQGTRGRYEVINSMARYVTLLTELGADVAKQASGLSSQWRVFVQRPDGKSGKPGRVSLGVDGKAVPDVILEGF